MYHDSFAASLLLLCCSSYAQDNSKPDSRHELRFGIGDMMFETVRWHNEVHKDYSAISSGTSKPEDMNFRYSPHMAFESSSLFYRAYMIL